MSRWVLVSTLAAGLSCLTLGCGASGSGFSSALAPSPPAGASAGTLRAASAGTHGQRLTAVLGQGTGALNVTPTAAIDGSFTAQIEVNVHDAPPNTTFYIQRAPEIGRANGDDGICQRAAGQPPWGPPAPNFLTFPMPAAGALLTLTTSAGGAGTAHVDFAAQTIADGVRFDVMFRLVDDLTAPANDLRTGCFTVAVK